MGTLDAFIEQGASTSYSLTALKKFTGTGDFLRLSSEEKGCEEDTFLKCQDEQYRAALKSRCGCIPWTSKYTKLSGETFCTPEQYKCTMDAAKVDCGTACVGLYADITHTEQMQTNSDLRLFLPLQEYLKYKQSFMDNSMFDPTTEHFSK